MAHRNWLVFLAFNLWFRLRRWVLRLRPVGFIVHAEPLDRPGSRVMLAGQAILSGWRPRKCASVDFVTHEAVWIQAFSTEAKTILSIRLINGPDGDQELLACPTAGQFWPPLDVRDFGLLIEPGKHIRVLVVG